MSIDQSVSTPVVPSTRSSTSNVQVPLGSRPFNVASDSEGRNVSLNGGSAKENRKGKRCVKTVLSKLASAEESHLVGQHDARAGRRDQRQAQLAVSRMCQAHRHVHIG